MLAHRLVLLAVLAVPASAAARAVPWVELEAGSAWQSRNVVRIPDDGGTRFSLTDLGSGPAVALRAYAGVRLGERHELRALWAPFRLEVDGALPGPVSFQREAFAAGVHTVGSYRFDSYRLTWRYALVRRDRWSLRAGVTAKVRDASIRLRQPGTEAVRSNVGLVPLLHLAAAWRIGGPFELLLDADALAAPQGRAEDVALLLAVRLSPEMRLRAGYRTVEGGVGGSGGVYNFAWLHAAVVGVSLEL